MKTLYLFANFLIVILIGCASKYNENEVNAIDIDLDESLNGVLSNVFSDSEYVLLSSNELDFLARPHKIKFDKDQNIYVSDDLLQVLFVFEPNGDFKFAIQPKGKGIKEFIQITDFNLLEDSILILDNVIGKVIIFDLFGDFIKEFKFRDKSSHFFQKNDYLLKFTSYRPDYDGFNFIKYNLLDGKSSGLVPFSIEKESIGNFNYQYSFINNINDNSVFYNIPYSYEIAEFDIETGGLKDLLVFDFKKYNFSESHYNLMKAGGVDKEKLTFEVSEKKLVKGIAAFLPFEKVNYLSIVQGDNAVRHTILIDKSKNVIFQQKDLLNDIDGMDFNRSPWSYTDDAIVFLDHTSRFLPKFKNRNELEDSPSKRKLEEFVKKNEEKLNDDYWVLAKYKFKDLNLK